MTTILAMNLYLYLQLFLHPFNMDSQKGTIILTTILAMNLYLYLQLFLHPFNMDSQKGTIILTTILAMNLYLYLQLFLHPFNMDSQKGTIILTTTHIRAPEVLETPSSLWGRPGSEGTNPCMMDVGLCGLGAGSWG